MSSNPKRAMYAAFAAVAKAIGHEHRLELLELVAQGERTVERLAECTGLSVANVSQHLQHLRRAGLVISRAELLKRIKNKSVVVLDVRPEDEFALGHISGARNVPLALLRREFSKLDAKKEIIAYCRGPYCVMSFEAVAELRRRGLTARRLEDGFPEWKAAGLPVRAPA